MTTDGRHNKLRCQRSQHMTSEHLHFVINQIKNNDTVSDIFRRQNAVSNMSYR